MQWSAWVFLSSLGSTHSRLEWTVAQWSGFQEAQSQLLQWMESVEQDVGALLPLQPGPKEKGSQLERCRTTLAEVESQASALARLKEKAVELHKKTGDQAFGEQSRSALSMRFADITGTVKVTMLSVSLLGLRLFLRIE